MYKAGTILYTYLLGTLQVWLVDAAANGVDWCGYLDIQVAVVSRCVCMYSTYYLRESTCGYFYLTFSSVLVGYPCLSYRYLSPQPVWSGVSRYPKYPLTSCTHPWMLPWYDMKTGKLLQPHLLQAKGRPPSSTFLFFSKRKGYRRQKEGKPPIPSPAPQVVAKNFSILQIYIRGQPPLCTRWYLTRFWTQSFIYIFSPKPSPLYLSLFTPLTSAWLSLLSECATVLILSRVPYPIHSFVTPINYFSREALPSNQRLTGRVTANDNTKKGGVTWRRRSQHASRGHHCLVCGVSNIFYCVLGPRLRHGIPPKEKQ